MCPQVTVGGYGSYSWRRTVFSAKVCTVCLVSGGPETASISTIAPTNKSSSIGTLSCISKHKEATNYCRLSKTSQSSTVSNIPTHRWWYNLRCTILYHSELYSWPYRETNVSNDICTDVHTTRVQSMLKRPCRAQLAVFQTHRRNGLGSTH